MKTIITKLIVLCLLPFGVFGATITVINNNDSGAGSLRQAILDASNGDVIDFNNNYTIQLTSGELIIDKNVTITGTGIGATIIKGVADVFNGFRVFNITSGTVTISDMTIRDGGRTDEGGGIYNSGTLTLNNCLVSNNSVIDLEGDSYGGGGIYNAAAGDLTLSECTISENEFMSSSHITYVGGGGILSNGNLTINNSTISSNLIWQSHPYSLEQGYGGGVCGAGSGTTTLANCTVFGNEVKDNGENNVAFGGGIAIFGGGGITLTNSTISGNKTNSILNYGAGIYLSYGTATVKNTIIAQNSDNASNYDYVYDYGTLTDGGYNLVEYSYVAANATDGFNNSTSILYNTKYNTASITESSWTQGGTSVSGSLELSSTLALNNSTNGTYTLALGETSFAAGSESTGIPPTSNWNGSPLIDGAYTDQRGVVRTASQNTSIGAYSENYTTEAPYYCLDFDGSDEYVQANTIAFSGSTLTIEAWIRPRTFNGAGDANITDLVKDANEKVVLRIGDGGIENNRLQFALSIGSTQYKLPSNTLLNASQWYHVAATYDGTNIKLYLNGSLDNSVGQTGNIDAGAGNLLIGGNATGRYMDGNIDEVRIWSTARSETDITDNICALVDATETGLLAYYRFDDGSGTTLSDVTGNGHNGTLQNMDGNSDWVNSYAMVIAEDASNITFNGFTANWDCPAEANSSFDDGYTIEYSTSSDFTGSATTTALISETSKAITGLADNTTYYYRVSGKRSDSETLEYSNVKSVTTNASSAPEYALDFDGSNDYVDCGTINLSGSAITLECWVNVDNFQSSSPYISQIMGTESGSNSAFLRLGDGDIPAGNKIEFALQIGAGAVQLTSISTLETGRWYHIAGVYDGSTMKIYINGVEDANASQSGSFTSNSDFYIASNDGTGRYLDGRVDEARIWNDARTPTEIQNNMCSRLAGTEDNLLAYYRFDNGSGTTLSDVTSNGHNGTLNNMDNADWINSYAMVIAEDATDITDEGFTANWSCPAQASSSYDDGYTIQYSTTSDFSSGNATTTALTSATSKSITGLTASTTYYYRVSGKRSGSGTLEYSNVKSFTTDAAYAPKYALDFERDNSQYANCGTINLSSSALTLECWIKPESFQTNSPYISQIMGTESGTNSAFLRLGDGDIPGGNKIEFVLYIGSGQVQLTSTSTLETGRWYHIAGVYDGSNMKIYINGVQDASNAQTGSFTSNSTFYIAAYNGSDRYFDGTVDEVRVWKTARSSTDINTYMTTLLNGNETNLEAYYRCDNGSGTALSDITSNGHNASLVNTPSWPNSYAMVIADDATNIAETSFTANWSCPSEANSSYDDGYTIQYSTTSDFSSGNSTTTALTSTTSKSITGLTASTTYYYRVSGKRSDDATLEYSNVKSVTTSSPQAPEYCLDFDGTNDYVSINSTMGLGATNVTIEAWVYISSTLESGTIARLGNNNSGFGIGVGNGNFDNDGNELLVLIDTKRWIDPNVSIGTGWHHVAFSVGATNGVKIYLDGANIHSEDSHGTAAVAPNTLSFIGTANVSNYRIFSGGKIDEVRYWGEVRTGTEIQNNMCSRLAGNESNLAAYYRFDDGTGTTLTDATSHGYNGTLQNMDNADWVNSYAMVLAEDATDIAETSFTANWDCPAEANSSFDDGYTIQYSTTSDFSSGNATTTALSSATSKSITGLSAGTPYYYRVSGKRSGSETLEYSNVKSLTTSSASAPNYCLKFFGNGDYVSIPADNSLNNAHFTVEFWTKFNYTPSGWNRVIDKGIGAETADWGILCVEGENILRFHYDGNEFDFLLNDLNWHHIAVTYDGTSFKGFLDGELVETLAYSSYTPSTNGINIGKSIIPEETFFYGGHMDEVRIWSDARTASEIKDNSCLPLEGNEANLVAYYKFDNGSGTAITDQTSNGNDGTLNYGASHDWWVNSYAMVLAEDATNIFEESLTVNWDCPAEANSSFSGYRIEYSENQNFSSSSTVDALASETSKTITGLTAATTYYYRVGGIRSSTVEYSNTKTTATGTFSTVVTSNLDNGGTSTLRYIIANCDEGATITFNLSSDNETITLSTEDIDITKSLTINGDNSAGSGTDITVQVATPGTGGSNFRVFDCNISSGKTINLSNMTLKGGDNAPWPYGDNGGSVYLHSGGNLELDNVLITGSRSLHGGGIRVDNSSLTMSNSEVSNCSCFDDNTQSGFGGAISLFYATGTISNCNILNNSVQTNGGGIYLANSTCTLTNSLIEGNQASGGGGLYQTSSSNFTINYCSITDNSAVSGYYKNGGGVLSNESNLSIDNSIISNNSTTNKGGGIYSDNWDYDKIININNSTIYGNSASFGGGVYLYYELMKSYDPFTTVIINTDICGNSSSNDGAGIYSYSSSYSEHAKLYLTNSVIAYNYKTDNTYNDLYNSNATLSGNYNIVGGLALSGNNNTNYSYTSGQGDPLFESYTTISEGAIYKPDLADNGGNTETVALASNSIAIATGVRTGEYESSGTKYVFWNGSSWVKVEDGTSIVSSGVTEITTDQRDEDRREDIPTAGSYAPDTYSFIWDGSSSSSWSAAANWNLNVVPSIVDNIIIPDISVKASALLISPSDTASCNNLTVESGGSLTIGSDATGTGSLLINGTASGDVTVERFLTADKWHYISEQTDVTGTFSSIMGLGVPGSSSNSFYRWDESYVTNEIPGSWIDILNGPTGDGNNNEMGSSFTACRGYAVTYAGSDKTLSLTGTPYVSNQSIPITSTAGSTNPGTNLVGNPFCSTIAVNVNADADNNFIDQNAAVLADSYEAVYIWNESEDWAGGNDYDTYNNASDAFYAAPGQAFMVFSASSSASLNFNTSARKNSNSTYYKGSKADYPSFRLTARNAELYNYTDVAFINGMTKGEDPSYDAGKLKGNPYIALYTRLVDDNGRDYAIQALDNTNMENYVIPVGIDVSEETVIEFSLNPTNLDNDVYLEDRLLNNQINLSEQNYSANITQSGVGRFYLHYSPVGIGETTNVNDAVQAYSHGKAVTIINNNGLSGKVWIMDIMGHTVSAYHLDKASAQTKTFNIPTGVYIVLIKADNGSVYTDKIILN